MASENNKLKLELFNRHWQNMPIQQQFETALGIIKNLPKDGKNYNIVVNYALVAQEAFRWWANTQIFYCFDKAGLAHYLASKAKTIFLGFFRSTVVQAYGEKQL